MTELTFTLVTDGPSDRALLHVIEWLLSERNVSATRGDWADLSGLRVRPTSLAEKVQGALELYPSDLLIVHRDAEAAPREKRVEEIRAALAPLEVAPAHVAVVPVRMTEAWLLCDEAAVRFAADNPNGTASLSLPKNPEALPDPKRALKQLLCVASEKSGRRLKKFKSRLSSRVQRVAELIDDFSPLRRLSAFVAFEAELDSALVRVTSQDPDT